MRTLIEFQHEAAARLLVAQLISQNLSARYQAVDTGHQVLIEREEDWQQAVDITRAFLANPSAAQYQQNAWEFGEQSQQIGQSGLALPSLSDILRTPLTSLIGLFCIVVYLLLLIGGGSWIQQWLFIIPWHALVYEGDWWRLFTPSIVHFSAMHIAFNLLGWFYLGAQIERKLGLSTLLLIFALTSVLANIAQLLVSGPNFGGLSGVVYALLGFVWWLGWLKPDWQLSLPKAWIGLALVWLVIGYADVLWVSMANTAHTVGLITGCMLAWLYVQIAKLTQKR
ncbi:rhomboid family intramembrane serine protease [Alteromonas sp. ASW11-36]|uniref:Rhomboid family intramembrane serine protease n=1 Tax=Alteromonas arenosi TaxID=3055817 RepID=A0ABT7STE9_9ALTE|nr:rhomboid family intramembrane serine protease [Alteromonas sp. ASW11-36]MDM7859264.1 rhomboid family intramembrane serine protease [Alteromonas sp. ASW11-36]